MLERKQLPFADLQYTAEGAGSLAGYASVFGEVDAYGDTIAPGAYQNTLAKFLQDGFVAWAHDDRVPIAFPTKAAEDDRGLWLEAAFHTTPAAQEARQIVAERLAAGKRSGLSIGYYARRAETTDDGVRRLLDIDLVEVSLVMSPADDHARVALVKAADLETKPMEGRHACRLRDPGDFQDGSFRTVARESDGKPYQIVMGRLKGESTMTEQSYRYPMDSWSEAEARAHCRGHDGMLFEPGKAAPCACARGDGLDYDTHAAHLDDYLSAYVTEFVARTRSGSELRTKEGRAISTARRERMAQVSGSLRKAADEIDAMLMETAPPEKAATAGYDPRLALALRAVRLRQLGVTVDGDDREHVCQRSTG